MKALPHSLTALLLIVTLTVTGFTAAMARAASPAVGALVICRGHEVVTILIDADGEPVEQRGVCPDVALALFADAGVAGDMALVERVWTSQAVVYAADPGMGRDAPAGNARGPPVTV